jgi:hypothetical protein
MHASRRRLSVDVDWVPGNSPIFAAVKFIESLDIFPAHLEIEHINIGPHTVRVLGLGKGYETGLVTIYKHMIGLRAGDRCAPALERPTNKDLCGVLAILLRY